MTPTDAVSPVPPVPDPKYGTVRLEAVQRCPACSGNGDVPKMQPGGTVSAREQCWNCGGTGEVRTPVLHPGEPFFLIRGKDPAAPKMVDIYAIIAEPPADAGALWLVEWLTSLRNRRDAIVEWQQANPSLVRPPD